MPANPGIAGDRRRYLAIHRPPTLIVWGPQDHDMPEASARACLRDLPDAELHLLDGGHWLLETNLDEMVALMRGFLARVHPSWGEGTKQGADRFAAAAADHLRPAVQ